MKIGLVSMQRVYNQGSFLQAYGLMKLLQRSSKEVKFIDIKNGISNEGFCEHFHEVHQVPYIKRKLIRLTEKKQEKILKQEQEKWLKLSDTYADDEKIDMAFVGSDEVFNCLAPSRWGVSAQLFGNIPNSKYVFSYAASCGHTTYEKLPKEIVKYLADAMQNFSSVSVRDENTYDFVKKITGIAPVYHLDPVLIYDFAEEIQLPKLNKPYMIVYSYSNRICDKQVIGAIKDYAKKNGLLTVGVGVFQYWCDKNIPVTPFQTLGYFKNAACVVTDTFHGTVISIKYNKQFVTMVRDSNRNKLQNLLDKFRLSVRGIEATEELAKKMSEKIDYKAANAFLDEEKKRTLSYIDSCLGYAENGKGK